MAAVGRQGASFAARDGTVVIVTFLPSSELAAFRAAHRLPFRVLGDPERRVYRRYGLERETVWHVFHPRAVAPYWRAWREKRGFRWPDPGDDLRQMGGDFLVDAEGQIRRAYYSITPADRPAVCDMLTWIDRG